MLTEKQSQLVRQLVTLNWEKDYNESETVREESREEYHRVQIELVKDMGFEAYTNFMEMGRQMFS
jgi:hypothetical protein